VSATPPALLSRTRFRAGRTCQGARQLRQAGRNLLGRLRQFAYRFPPCVWACLRSAITAAKVTGRPPKGDRALRKRRGILKGMSRTGIREKQQRLSGQELIPTDTDFRGVHFLTPRCCGLVLTRQPRLTLPPALPLLPEERRSRPITPAECLERNA